MSESTTPSSWINRNWLLSHKNKPSQRRKPKEERVLFCNSFWITREYIFALFLFVTSPSTKDYLLHKEVLFLFQVLIENLTALVLSALDYDTLGGQNYDVTQNQFSYFIFLNYNIVFTAINMLYLIVILVVRYSIKVGHHYYKLYMFIFINNNVYV